jgi:hypothetical protein
MSEPLSEPFATLAEFTDFRASLPIVTAFFPSFRVSTAWKASFGVVTAPRSSCAVPTLSLGRLAPALLSARSGIAKPITNAPTRRVRSPIGCLPWRIGVDPVATTWPAPGWIVAAGYTTALAALIVSHF